MSDTTLTDAQVAAIEAAVAAHEGRYRWVQLPVADARALLNEVKRLRAENERLRDKQDGAGWTVHQGDR